MILTLTTGYRLQTLSLIQVENIVKCQDKIEIKVTVKINLREKQIPATTNGTLL